MNDCSAAPAHSSTAFGWGTRFSEVLWKTPDIRDAYLRATPMGRSAQPEEMAGAVVYLCSDAASCVTGHTLVLDGGHLA